jgi:hypothetical protein
MKVTRTLRFLAALSVVAPGLTVLTLPGSAVAATPIAAQDGALTAGDSITMSRLAGFVQFQLPDNARRLADTSLANSLGSKLKALAREEGLTLNSTEVVLYESKGDNTDAETREMLRSTLNGASYTYDDLGETSMSGLRGHAFRAKEYSGTSIFGFWFVRNGYQALVWGTTVKPGTAPGIYPPESAGTASGNSAGSTTISASHPTPVQSNASARPARGSGKAIPTPSSLIGGEWKWTSISRIGHKDQFGRLAAPGGMSARYTFLSGGRYKFFYYVRQQTYGFISESTTTAEGTVTFYDNGTFLVRPTKGYYRGSNGSRDIDRPMSASERKPVLWYWEWRNEGGKRKLYIGPGPSSMSPFTRG